MDPEILAQLADILGAVDQETVEAVVEGRSTIDLDINRLSEIAVEYRTQMMGIIDPQILEQMSLRELEDAATQHRGLPTFSEILDNYDLLRQIRDQIVHAIAVLTDDLLVAQNALPVVTGPALTLEPHVLTPPDPTRPIEPGSGVGIEDATFHERLTTLLCILYDLDLDPNDLSQVQVHIGPIWENMMREVTYASVLIPSLQRLVELCNEVGNRSFIWQSDNPADIQFFGDMTKTQKGAHLVANNGSGESLLMRAGWEQEMRRLLTEPFVPPQPPPNIPSSPTPPPSPPPASPVDISDPALGPMNSGATPQPCNPAPPKRGRIRREILERGTLAQELRKALEAEGVVEIIVQNPNPEGGKPLRVLFWKKTISLTVKIGENSLQLSTLLGYVTGLPGYDTYTSFSAAIPAIRALYAGMYDTEDATPDMRFEMANQEEKKTLLRSALERDGVVQVMAIEKEGQQTKKVLFWKKIQSPQKKLSGFTVQLNTQLGQTTGMHVQELSSFSNTAPAIRALYAGMYDEEDGTPDMQFEMAKPEEKKAMLRSALEREGILEVIMPEDNEEMPKKTLFWKKVFNPRFKFQGYETQFFTQLGQIHNINGKKAYTSFSAAIPAIRALYAGMYDEEDGTPDMQFEMAKPEEKKAMLRSALEREGIVEITLKEKEGNELRILIWNKVQSPQKKLAGFTMNLNAQLSQTIGAGAQKFSSFSDTVPAIRSLYKGMFDAEGGTLDMQFEIAELDQKRAILRSELEKEGVTEIIIKEQAGGELRKILLWKKIMSPRKKFSGYSMGLDVQLGQVNAIGGTENYTTVASTISPIRSLYEGMFDAEEWQCEQLS